MNNQRIHNNTIVQNVNEGIRRSGGSVPTIKNCILYYNNDQNAQLAGLYPSHITWSCISDCNDINNQHNINDLPGFVYADPNGMPVAGNFHLVWDSPCVDAGDSDSYTSESDMDGDGRVYGDKVEIGADEVTCTETSHPNDWNSDGVINMAEFAVFSHAWLSQAGGNDPNWNPACNLDNTGTSANVIDLADLILFCEDDPQVWLWVACWRTDLLEMQQQQSMQMMMGNNPSPVSSATVAASASEPISETNWVTATEPSEVDSQAAAEEPPVVEEKSIEEQILDLQDSIEFLEQIWTEESDIQQEIDAEDWKEFMDSVYQSLSELETLKVENTEAEG